MIIWGWRTYAQVLAVLTLVCGNCGVPAEHVLRRMTTKFTLFWIPLFPVNRKHILACSSCQTEAKLSGEQAAQLAAGGAAAPQQPGPAQPPPMPAPQPAYGAPAGFHGGPPPHQQPFPAQPGPPPGYRPPPPNYGPPRPPHAGHPMPGPAPYQQPGYPPAGYPPPGR